MPVHQAPFDLEPKDVRDAVRPFNWLVDAVHAYVEPLDVGRIGEFAGCDRGEVPITHPTALELLARPVPALRDSLPAFFIATPAVEAGRIVAVRIERLDAR